MAEAAVRERQMAHLMEYGGGASSSGGAGGGGSGIGGSTGGGITDNDDDDRFSQISGTSSFLNGPPGAVRNARKIGKKMEFSVKKNC